MRKLIKRIIDWAYGSDLGADIILLKEMNEKLSSFLHNLEIRNYIKPGAVVKEDEL